MIVEEVPHLNVSVSCVCINLMFCCFAPHPSTLVVKNTDIFVGLQPPPVSRAALGFIHIMAEVFRSWIRKAFPWNSIKEVTHHLTPDLSCCVSNCQKVLWIEWISVHSHDLALMTPEILSQHSYRTNPSTAVRTGPVKLAQDPVISSRLGLHPS